MRDRVKSVLIYLKRVGRRDLKSWHIKKNSDLVKVRGVLCPLENNQATFLLDSSYFLLRTVWSALCLRQKVFKK